MTTPVFVHDTRGGFEILRIIRGCLTEHELETVKDAISSALEGGPRRFALSLASETYPFSRYIALLVLSSKLADEYGSTLVVAGANDEFMAVIRKVGLDSLVTFVATEDELGSSVT